MSDLGKQRLSLLNSIAENLGQPTDSRVKVATLVAEMAGVKPTTLLQATYGQCHLSSDAIDRIKARLQSHHWAQQLNYDLLRNPNRTEEAPPTALSPQEGTVATSTASPDRRRGRPPGRPVRAQGSAPAPAHFAPAQPIGTLPLGYVTPATPTGASRKLTVTLPQTADLSNLEIDLSNGYLVVRVKL